jgi:hypothetical protein
MSASGLHDSTPARTRHGWLDRHEANRRLPAPGQDDVVARLGAAHERRQLPPRFRDRDLHGHLLQGIGV